MNREIKFRVWDKETKRFVQFDTDIEGRKGYNLGEYALTPEGKLCFYESTEGGMDRQDFENVEISFFTGLLDKNEKPIYEGDILKSIFVRDNHEHEGPSGIVEWEQDWCAFEIDGNSLRYFKWEILGNIFENEDLLKDHLIK